MTSDNIMCCIIIEGRKNGKTTETAAVEIDMLINDQEGAPQIYNIATMLDQAKLRVYRLLQNDQAESSFKQASKKESQ